MRDRLRRPSRATIAALAAVGVVLVALLTLALRSGGGDSGARRAAATSPAPDRPIVRHSFLEQVIPARGSSLPGAGVPGKIAAEVKAMPVADKVAELMLLGFDGQDASSSAPVLGLLHARPLGGIVIRSANYASTAQVTALAGQATLVARAAKHDPPFIWAPQEGGAFTAIPPAGPADAAGDVQNARTAAAEGVAAGRILSRLDLNGVLAPVVDVGTEGGGTLGSRTFSNDPAAVSSYAVDMLAAYRRAGVVSAAEHFPGLGAATQPVEDGPASVGLTLGQLRKRDLVPFAAAIRAGVPAIVISNASYATDDFVTPATLSHAVSTDLLRGEMRFQGVAIADDLSEPAITNDMSVADAAVQAVQAGSDMVYISGPARGQEAAYQQLLAAAKSGKLPRARLDEAVTRILTLKREYGLVRGLRPRTAPPAVPAPAAPGTPGATTPAAPVPTTPAQPSTQPGAPPGH